MEKILVIGGAGYVGTVLCERLVLMGYDVSVYDLFIYGDNFRKDLKINKIKGDVRNLELVENALDGIDRVIHLACISNDPSFELNPLLGKQINFDCFEPLVKLCKKKKIKHFVYASSSSVYGIKEEANVTENSSLEPITDYSKFKVMCEKILLNEAADNFFITIIRPATVCGFSPRLRLDLVVNILTNLGYHNGVIKIFGGKQLRPNINIKDMCGAYVSVIKSEYSKIKDQIFNVGFENHSVENLALMVKKNIGDNIHLQYVETNDNRSYHISSKKIVNEINFQPEFDIDDAIKSLLEAFNKKLIKHPLNNEEYFNIKKMKSINLK